MSTISPDLEQFVQDEVDSGRYADRSAVIAHPLALLRRDREEALAGIRAGLDDLATGRFRLASEAFDDLRREFNISNDE